MELFEAMKKRHSYRGPFTSAPVSKEELIRIIEAGICAPSGKNMQTTSFIGVVDEGLRRELAALVPNKAMETAAAVLVFATHVDRTKLGYSFELEDYAAACENILLAITALGYAGVWIDGQLRTDERYKAVAKLLKVPEGKTVRAVLPFGVPQNEGSQREKLPFEERAVIL